MQGFLVKAVANGSLGVSNMARTISSQSFYKNGGANPIIRLAGANTVAGSSTDETVIYFDPMATDTFDNSLDAVKVMNNDPAIPNVYSMNSASDNLSINALPPIGAQDVIVPVRYLVDVAGTYYLDAIQMANFDPNLSIYLEDVAQTYLQDLKVNPYYSFSINPGDNPNRFYLRFSMGTTGVEEGLGDQFSAYTYIDNLFVTANLSDGRTGHLEIFNTLGQKVFDGGQIGSGTHQFKLETFATGYYMVRLTTSEDTFVKKVYIK